MRKKIKHKTVTKIDSSSLKEDFPGTINVLVEKAKEHGVTLTNKDIADAISITEEQFNNYYRFDNAPAELFKELRVCFGEYLQYRYIQKITVTTQIDVPDPLDEEDTEE